MESDKKKGWWGAPPGEIWVCPNCKEPSPVEEWEEAIIYCEDCGDHDGRVCPRCDESYDHVWGAEAIREATEERLGQSRNDGEME